MSERILSLASLTVLEISPPQMVEVAARAGYSHVGLRLVPATPQEHHFALVADAELRRQTLSRLRDTGICVLDVEILRLKPQTRVADFEAVLAVGAEFGASELLVAGNDPDEARMTERFAELCDLASIYGLHPHLEFMPWTDARDLQQAVRVVENAGRDNAAVLVDAFHFDRSASRLEDLAKVAPSRLRYAQLCDVAGPRPDDMQEILRQARNERRFPGDGDCDLAGLLHCLPANLPLSLEIPTVKLLEQGVGALERAQMALDKTRALLARI
ncbi:Sugar phosphate isomerase/epimerase [Pseudomonas chlororaphis]|uniref:sugar phosphate isomerase/epimerase family protein n=1 Tax=Pseudomonas chlororaphis TaxID=587753 RepID=UPI00050D1975|nr:sugar phosphate isomerase/epimerase [Pseudomonas chlororaphis]AIS10938.1 xylose isomerase [Pseudomonas chlororaphis subsp. aurantiaca]AZD50939.1 Sugar phosphate isomerase/epimerase [Pseudomonas chlororaphis subsp. aurantiaca]AZD63154.1 Sugar phosphate isomerase/epimerase [Pseudomonas chlororaphis subsp. aurantiaca]AZD69568.1 Sugar phosphate isomerase/epimerase [Pseudomonas chlororaphis subsp. aurantiaca]QIT25398.1 sugar phosphate isomerase/epimerase [Pseudomonas chlororaphis subsp. aurantia